jgi:sulfur carrier protein ThiS
METASIFLPGAREPIAVPAGQTILEALQAVDIGLEQPAVVLVNGQAADITHRLAPGDQVRVLYQIAGGAR